MVTQMYFPGDPLFPLDPIYQSVVDPQARERLVATYDHDLTQPEWCTGYRWDIVLTGPHRTLDGGGVTRRPPARRSGRSSATRCRSRTTASWCLSVRRARSRCAAASSTAPASRCRTRSWSSGRRAWTAVSSRSRAHCGATGSGSPGSAGRRPTWTGRYAFTTVVPGAPFFAITVFARGLLNRLFTRAYLPDMAGDPFLETLEADRRSTLLTTQDETGYVFDVHLQGERETVFLAYPRHEP